MANLTFTLVGRSDSGKTNIWQVNSAHRSEVVLGEIRWYAPWRRYWFVPSNAGFDADCLLELAKFLNDEMQMHRENL